MPIRTLIATMLPSGYPAASHKPHMHMHFLSAQDHLSIPVILMDPKAPEPRKEFVIFSIATSIPHAIYWNIYILEEKKKRRERNLFI